MEETPKKKYIRDDEPPWAYLVGFNERRERVVNIPLFRKVSSLTYNSFLKCKKLEQAIPAGVFLHVFNAKGRKDSDDEKETLEF